MPESRFVLGCWYGATPKEINGHKVEQLRLFHSSFNIVAIQSPHVDGFIFRLLHLPSPEVGLPACRRLELAGQDLVFIPSFLEYDLFLTRPTLEEEGFESFIREVGSRS